MFVVFRCCCYCQLCILPVLFTSYYYSMVALRNSCASHRAAKMSPGQQWFGLTGATNKNDGNYCCLSSSAETTFLQCNNYQSPYIQYCSVTTNDTKKNSNYFDRCNRQGVYCKNVLDAGEAFARFQRPKLI